MSQFYKKILFIHNNPTYEKRINYILEFIANHPLANGKVEFVTDREYKSPEICIFYGSDEETCDFKIPAQKLIFNQHIPNYSALKTNQYANQKTILFSVEKELKLQTDFLIEDTFQFDIIETIFFHISRFEEWYFLAGNEDEHGRMSSKNQFLVKNRLYQRPVVDELVFCFLNALGIKTENSKTQFRLTHDIDYIERKNNFWRILRSIGGAILKRQNPRSAYLVWKYRHEKNAYDTFNWMLRKEENFEKVIYFLMGGESKFDNTYDLNLPVVQKAFQLCQDRKYQIGIHPSYETWKDEELYRKEWKKLEEYFGKPIVQTRQHFLHFSFKHTPKIIANLSLREDSSLGFSDLIGFRCGTGFAYRLYDFEKEKAFDFLETPLIVMDSALFKEGDFRAEKIKKILFDFINKNQFNTKITLNFHNSSFYNAQVMDIPLRSLYERLLAEIISPVSSS